MGMKKIPVRKRQAFLITITLPDGQSMQAECDQFPFEIGREDDCLITIEHPTVSRKHACVSLADGGGHTLHVQDLGSSNGTFVSNFQVTEANLPPSGEFFVGSVNVVIVQKPSSAKASSSSGTVDYWLYTDVTGVQHGPISDADLIRLVGAGVVGPETLLQKGEHRVTAKNVDGLVFPSSPAAPSTPVQDNFTPPTFSGGEVSRIDHEPTGDLLCPHCWWRFDFHEMLYIAQHDGLYGDPVLGPEERTRFLPSRFTTDGRAIDAGGQECPDTACPRCHLFIPKVALFSQPLIISVVGAPSSGKSYLLSTMIWELRHLLPSQFGLSFSDADATTNQVLNGYEQLLFCSPTPDSIVALRKTEEQGELYSAVHIENMKLWLPKPFFFNLKFQPQHPMAASPEAQKSYSVVFYDNAGEHFQPGADKAASPATRHLVRSDAIFFVFDPTQDPRFRARCIGITDPQVQDPKVTSQQTVLMTEMIARVRRHTGMNAAAKFDKPLFIILHKFDVWRHLVSPDLRTAPICPVVGNFVDELEINEMFSTSFALRTLMLELCSGIVHMAEDFAEQVIYLPVSAFGRNAERMPESGGVGIRPRDIQPIGVTMPVLYTLATKGFVGFGSEQPEGEVHQAQALVRGDLFKVSLPGGISHTLPVTYLHKRLRCPKTGVLFVASPPEENG